MLSPERLGISYKERDALVTVRDLLAAGKLKHGDDLVGHGEDGPGFNMKYSAATEDCGTVCCIGGWMHMIMAEVAFDDSGDLTDALITENERDNAYDYVFRTGATRGLKELFFPSDPAGLVVSYDCISPSQAVQAIDNFLNTGRPDWRSVVVTNGGNNEPS